MGTVVGLVHFWHSEKQRFELEKYNLILENDKKWQERLSNLILENDKKWQKRLSNLILENDKKWQERLSLARRECERDCTEKFSLIANTCESRFESFISQQSSERELFYEKNNKVWEKVGIKLENDMKHRIVIEERINELVKKQQQSLEEQMNAERNRRKEQDIKYQKLAERQPGSGVSDVIDTGIKVIKGVYRVFKFLYSGT